jgi:hypothetical protein
MAIKKYAIQAIRLLGASPVNLQQITQRTINPRTRVIYNAGAGQFSPSFAGVVTVEPEISFDTTDIENIFGTLGVSPINGLSIGTGLTYTGAEYYFEGKKDMGGRVAALLSLKAATSKAFLVPQSLTVEHGGEARLSCLIASLSSDGTTSPLAYTDLVTPPTVAASEKFTLGPVKINGSTIDSGVMGWTLDFGITVEMSGHSGQTYASFATIARVEPKITIRVSDVSLAATFLPTGTNLATGATVYLRKFQTSSVVYPDASAEHIAFSIPSGQGIVFPGSSSGSGSQDVNQEFELRPLAGSSAMIAVAVDTAIT